MMPSTIPDLAAPALTALGDATRRAILTRIAAQPATVADLARALPVSQPAVSQHVKVLRDARLIRGRTEGRRTIYQLDPDGAEALRRWLDRMWGSALGHFADYVDQNPEDKTDD